MKASGEGDSGNSRFAIPTGTHQLVTAAVFDFEVQQDYSIRIRVTDPQGHWNESILTVHVADAVESQRQIVLSQSQVVENAEAGTEIGQAVATDADSPQSQWTVWLVPGVLDNADFPPAFLTASLSTPSTSHIAASITTRISARISAARVVADDREIHRQHIAVARLILDINLHVQALIAKRTQRIAGDQLVAVGDEIIRIGSDDGV